MPFDQTTPRPFTAVTVRIFAPVASGVYGISNSREWIYIGETDNIQDALLLHLMESGQDNSLPGKLPTGFVFEVCDRGRRVARQDRLVFEYEPTGNRRSSRYP